MGYSTFGDDALAHAVGSHFYTIEEFVRQHYDDLANEDNMCGSLQALLMVDVMIDKLKDAYRKTGYQLDVEFVAKKDRTEPETGVDLSLLLKIYTHPMQTVEGFRDVGFFARNQKKKSLLVQTKNLRTTYGTTVRSDQLANLAERTENGGVVWWLSRKGIEVASVNDLLERKAEHYADVPDILKYDFASFMYNFFETNVGDHDPRLFSAVESGRLSDYVRYTIRPPGLDINQEEK